MTFQRYLRSRKPQRGWDQGPCSPVLFDLCFRQVHPRANGESNPFGVPLRNTPDLCGRRHFDRVAVKLENWTWGGTPSSVPLEFGHCYPSDIETFSRALLSNMNH